MAMSFLCWIGVHQWERVATWSRKRVCKLCGRGKLDPMDTLRVMPRPRNDEEL